MFKKSYKIIKNYSKNNGNPLIMNLVKYLLKTELLPLDSMFLAKNQLFLYAISLLSWLKHFMLNNVIWEDSRTSFGKIMHTCNQSITLRIVMTSHEGRITLD
jgi:hypothetical protein